MKVTYNDDLSSLIFNSLYETGIPAFLFISVNVSRQKYSISACGECVIPPPPH